MEKPKINNYNSLENIDENREKFVQEFNEKVVDLDFLENSDNAFKMTKNLANGKEVDIYTVHKGDFNLLVSSPFLVFMNPIGSDIRNNFFCDQENIIKASKMSFDEMHQEFGFGNNYISTSFISNENFKSLNWGLCSPWSFGYSQIESNDIINGGASDQWTSGEKTLRGEISEISSYLYNDLHFDDKSYNEIALWCYEDIENSQPRKPDFIVTGAYTTDEFKSKNIDLAAQAAAEFNVPVVIFDEESFTDQKISEIDSMMERHLNGEISNMDFLNSYLRGAQSFDLNYPTEQKLYANEVYQAHLNNIGEIMKNLRHNSDFKNEKSSEKLFENLQNIRDIYLKRDAVIQSWSDAFISKAGLTKGLFAVDFSVDNKGNEELEYVISEADHNLRREMFEIEKEVLENIVANKFKYPQGTKEFLSVNKPNIIILGGREINLEDESIQVNLPDMKLTLGEGAPNFIKKSIRITKEEIEDLKKLFAKIEK